MDEFGVRPESYHVDLMGSSALFFMLFRHAVRMRTARPVARGVIGRAKRHRKIRIGHCTDDLTRLREERNARTIRMGI